MDKNDPDREELVNTTESGAPPRDRIGSASAARRIYLDLCENSLDWARSRVRIQGLYDGNSPKDQAKLESLGRGGDCNVNFREAEAIIDSNSGAAWSLIMDVGPLVDCKIDRTMLPPDGSGDEWGDVIADEYTATLRDWDTFYYNVDQVAKDCFKYGVGGQVWPDEWDWRSRAFQLGNLKVPARATFDLDRLDLYCLNDTRSIHELYELTENREVAEKAGWNIGAIKKLLVAEYRGRYGAAGSDDDREGTSDWESFQTSVRTYDPGATAMTYDDVRIVHIVVREAAPGAGVSHYVIPDVEGEDVEFLFEQKGQFRSMKESMWLLPHNFGDGCKIRSVKGLGHRILPHCEFSNRFLCQLFDSGMLSSSLLVSLQGAATSEEMQVLRLGSVTVLPSSLNPVQTSFMPKMEGLVGLRTLSREIMSNSIAAYRPRLEAMQPQSAYPTAQQVREQAKVEARFEKSQATFMYLCWEKWHREVFRRMTNPSYVTSRIALPGQAEAQAFLMRCMQRGVPPQILLTPGAVKVYSARALGIGSEEDRKTLAMQLQGMKPFMDERGRKWADRQWALAFLGYWNVDKAFPSESRDNSPSNAMSFAIQENNNILDGRSALAGSDQPHAIHLQVHMAPLARYAEAFQKYGPQGVPNLVEAATAFRLGLPHVQEHLQFLAQDPTRAQQIQPMMQALQMMAQIGQQIIQASEQLMVQNLEAQQAQAEKQAIPAEVQMKMAKNEQDFVLRSQQQEMLNQNRLQKAKDQVAIAAQKAQASLQIAAGTAATMAEIEKMKAQADVAIKAMKAAPKAGTEGATE